MQHSIGTLGNDHNLRLKTDSFHLTKQNNSSLSLSAKLIVQRISLGFNCNLAAAIKTVYFALSDLLYRRNAVIHLVVWRWPLKNRLKQILWKLTRVYISENAVKRPSTLACSNAYHIMTTTEEGNAGTEDILLSLVSVRRPSGPTALRDTYSVTSFAPYTKAYK